MSKIYVLDTNAIRELSRDLIESKKSDGRMIITIQDVEFEVHNENKTKVLDVLNLDDKAYKKMAEIVNGFQSVRNLIDYYNNKGTADVALLAFALTFNEGTFFDDEIIIVTEDKDLRIACDELKTKWLSINDFKMI